MKETVKLGSVLSDIAMGPFGSNLKVENFQEHGVPVIRGKNLSGFYVSDENLVFVSPEKAAELSRSLARPGEIVVTHRGTLGQVSLIPANGKYPAYLVSQSQMRLAVDPRLADARFITYWMRSRLGQLTLSAFATQTGVPAIAQPTTSLSAYPISLPSLSSQSAIASVLGSLDDKIAANQAVIDTGNDLLMSLYRGTPKHGAEPFEQVCDVYGGSTPSTKVPEYWGGEIQWATPTDLTALKGPWLDGTERTITEDGLRSMSSILHPAGSILMTSRATIGSVALATGPVTTNQGFIVVRATEDLTPWTYCQLRDRVLEFEAWANGATFLELSRGNFRKLAFQRAEPERLAAFNKTAWPLLEMCKTKQTENVTLANTRDELLPLLMNGKISVREAKQEATSAGADIPSEEIEA